MTEKGKMLAGEIYSAVDPQLIEELTEVKCGLVAVSPSCQA